MTFPDFLGDVQFMTTNPPLCYAQPLKRRTLFSACSTASASPLRVNKGLPSEGTFRVNHPRQFSNAFAGPQQAYTQRAPLNACPFQCLQQRQKMSENLSLDSACHSKAYHLQHLQNYTSRPSQQGSPFSTLAALPQQVLAPWSAVPPVPAALHAAPARAKTVAAH